MMIEPTERESKEEEELNLFIDAMKAVPEEIEESPEIVLEAPHNTRVSRMDETTAARKPVLRWRPSIKEEAKEAEKLEAAMKG